MVVQHNIQAMNANRMLNTTSSAQSKSTEKLSSGYKINRAADDAAGLSISEKMRKQIRGLDQASTNAEDGISAVQTAEGALTEVHSMLQRMNELAVQAANGTNSDSDRKSIQDEITQLTTEIDRVAETTKFNESYLLKGEDSATTKFMTLEAHDAGLDGTMGTLQADGKTITYSVSGYTTGTKHTIAGVEYEIVADGSQDYANGKITSGDAYSLITTALRNANAIGINKSDGDRAANVTSVTNATVGSNDWTIVLGAANVAKALSFNLHVGADAEMTNKIGVEVETMNSAYLGIKDISVLDSVLTTGGLGATLQNKTSMASGTAATYAIDAIADAVKKVSKQRSALGAIQNRLEHTVSNLDNIVENTTAAESRIRDTDMAEETVDYSKNNILTQAGQSMLAQANQTTRGVLTLLQ